MPWTEQKAARNEQIRNLYATGKYTQDELGRVFNLHPRRIGEIIRYNKFDSTGLFPWRFNIRSGGRTITLRGRY